MASIPQAAHIILQTLEPVNGKTLTLEVPAGEGSPTVTDGYGGWEVVNRPFRTGLTVWRGFSPIILSVPLLFEGFDEGKSLEGDIEVLELMAGRGRDGGPVRPPPVLRLHSGSIFTDRDSGLIPANYRTLTDSSIVWVINDIDWDDSPLRNSSGNRIRQACTVTLMQFVGPEKLAIPAAKGKTGTTGVKTIRVKQGDTLRSLAKKYLGDSDRWTEIKRTNNLKSSKLKVGQTLKIKVPVASINRPKG